MSIKSNNWLIVFILVLQIMATPFYAQKNKTSILNNLDEALIQYRSICNLDYNNYAAFNNLGNIYFLQSVLDSAEISYRKAAQILDSLVNDYQTTDTIKCDRLRNIREGIILNLGTLYAAAGLEEKAYEMYGKVVKDTSDIPKVRVLLGLPFEEEDYTRANKPDISAAKVEYMISETSKKQKKQQQKKPTKPKGKKKSKKMVRKGTRPEGNIADVFYWIY